MSDAASKQITKSCAAGEVATGGGHQLIGEVLGRVVTRSFPAAASPNRLAGEGTGPVLGGRLAVKTWVVCAKL